MKTVFSGIASKLGILAIAALVLLGSTTSANAQTTLTPAQLQALIQQFQAMFPQYTINPPTQSRYVFTRNMTIGSTGTEVTALQSFLISRGHNIMAGATGYFGYQTQAALASFQRANGITPAVGYFGPITRAYINALPAPVPNPTPNPTNPNPTTPNNPTRDGSEGTLRSIETLGDVEASIEENEEDARVLGIEMEARDSDIYIERVDVDFEKTGGGNDNLEDYVESVSLWFNDRQIAEMDVEDADDDDDVFSFRFTGLNSRIAEDDTAELYVAINAVGNLDTADENEEWTVTIPENGLRASDEASLSETYVTDDLSETFSFEGEATSELDISEAAENPDEGLVIVDEDNDTDDVLILAFELEADEDDVTIENLPIGLTTTGADVDDIITSVELRQGNTVVDTRSIPSNAGTYEAIVFDDVDVTVGADENETFTVYATVRNLEGDFTANDTIVASTTGSMTGWEVEDEDGDDVTPSGSATGEAQTFTTTGISVRLVDTEAESMRGQVAGEDDRGQFRIVFDVTAMEDDIYIDRSTTRATSGTAGQGVLWSTSTDTTATINSATGLLSSSRTEDEDTSNVFFIEEGETRRFTLTVDTAITASGAVGVVLNAINWTDDASDTTPDNFYSANLDSFRTDHLFLYAR